MVLVLISTIHCAATVRYVDANNPSPLSPFTNWSTAANVIQDAVDVAEANDELIVTNGLYRTGGFALAGGTSNRVALTKPITLRSANGPAFTVIEGYQMPVSIVGTAAVRCVYLTNGASLRGFTLTNGATRCDLDGNGGGVWAESTSVTVSNCLLVGNQACGDGGGAFGATLIACIASNNAAFTAGGGGASCNWVNSIVVSNLATIGGGAYAGSHHNSLFVQNVGYNSGGGTVAGAAYNCIIYYNSSSTGQYDFDGTFLDRCCSMRRFSQFLSSDNFTNAPQFVDLDGRDFHLQSTSPCINSGSASSPSPLDADGNQRLVGSAVDVGPYEIQNPSSTISYLWLLRYGLPQNGSVDAADLDGDGHDTWQEWRAGTVPTNAASVLRIITVTNAAIGLNVAWQGANTYYGIERATNSNLPIFFEKVSGFVGAGAVGVYNDKSATNSPFYLYRIRKEYD